MGFFGLDNNLLVLISVAVIVISLIVIIAGIFIILKRKSAEEKHAEKILVSLKLLKEGKKIDSKQDSKSSEKAPSPSLEIRKEETSLKQLLIKKFKPKVEQQLGSKIEVLDFNAKENNFLLLALISGVKILLTLDASGKIIDYKKVKQKE
ncbi:MAG: hypothetical protein WCW44_00190 [archaeon]|jgi:low affinity Fe/Cu permease